MTTTLLPGLLKALALNVGRGHGDVQIVEIGRVFHPQTGADGAASAVAPIYPVDERPSADQIAAFADALPEQPEHVAFLLDGERQRSGWGAEGRRASWADAIAIVQRIADTVHVPIDVRQASCAPWHPGRCAEIVLDGRVIGHAGELHPRVVRDHDAKPERGLLCQNRPINGTAKPS